MSRLIQNTVCAAALFLVLQMDARAQETTLGDTDIEVFNIAGSVSNEAHAYTTTRDVNRRAPLGNVTTANLNFSVLGFDSGLNLRYDTDNSDFRQSVNRIGFSGSWRWISLSAGDVSPSWSRYSLSGTRLRGGQLELTPGNFIFEASAGRAARAVGPSEEESVRRVSFHRMLYGSRIGYGNTGGSYFTLSGFYAKDDQESITLPEDGDQLFSARNSSPPAENLLISPEMQLSFFDRSFQLGMQGSASAFTRDLRSEAVDVDEAGIPSIVTDLIEINTSSRMSYAGSVFTRLRVDPVELRLDYERFQPGFRSMGLRSVRDDRHSYSAELGTDLFNRRVQLNNRLGFNEDNLLGDRATTQSGIDYTVNATTRITNQVSLTSGYTINTSSSEPDDPQSGGATSRNVNQNFQLQPTVNFMRDETTHTISLSAFYQTNVNEVTSAQAERVTEGHTLNGALNYSLTLFDGLSFNSSVNGLVGNSGGSDITNFGVNSGVGYSFFDGDLSTNLNLGYSVNRMTRPGIDGRPGMESVSRQFNGNGTLSWQVTGAGSLRFNVRSNSNFVSEGQGAGFSEFESRLSFNYNF